MYCSTPRRARLDARYPSLTGRLANGPGGSRIVCTIRKTTVPRGNTLRAKKWEHEHHLSCICKLDEKKIEDFESETQTSQCSMYASTVSTSDEKPLDAWIGGLEFGDLNSRHAVLNTGS